LNRLSATSPNSTLLPGNSENYETTSRLAGYVRRSEANRETYTKLGFKSGLEIHQQLLTAKKLFCHCPAGLYQHGEFDAEIVRHMRPTLSEMGEYDGTALMEKKTRKTIIYRIKSETACTYDFDDTPPFKIDQSALDIALEIGLMLRCNLVGELHIARKQYLDGSIPTGFQRTGIVGIEGEIPLEHKKVRIIQLSIEEDSCREVSDIGHLRVYTTDRLGMPLIETVTYPDMLTPDEVAEAAHYLRLLVRTSGKVRTGIGAAREDVNVSIEGGTRVEIKGVSHISWIPELTHNEAFRQKALLIIKTELAGKYDDPTAWRATSRTVTSSEFKRLPDIMGTNLKPTEQMMLVNLPGFRNLLSHFTQPGKCFADEISERLKVIACLERPNMIHSESDAWFDAADASAIARSLQASDCDAQLLFWGPADDMATALETVEERCRLAFVGVPNETRKSFADGTTIFERVLPGPDRMYPDTDSAPISIPDEHIEKMRAGMVSALPDWLDKLRIWGVPPDARPYLIRRNLVPIIESLASDTAWPAKFIALLYAHTVKGLTRKKQLRDDLVMERMPELCRLVHGSGYDRSLVKEALSAFASDPSRSVSAVVKQIAGSSTALEKALAEIPKLAAEFERISKSRHPQAKHRWLVGRLKSQILGRVGISHLSAAVAKEMGHV
jgi:glutamyl-tRNA(Gln) amidotransferase subunit E